MVIIILYLFQILLQETEVETAKQNGKRNKYPHIAKPEEHEGMPQHQHCLPSKHREDRKPKSHEEQQKDVVRPLAAHPPKSCRKGK
jgi:hypothetical protein